MVAECVILQGSNTKIPNRHILDKELIKLQADGRNVKNKTRQPTMLVLAWNPLDVEKAIPPYCHMHFK